MDKNTYGVEGKCMKGWKIPRIIHMFTQPLKRPGGGPHKHETDKGPTTKDMTSTLGDPNLMKWGDGCYVREKIVAGTNPLQRHGGLSCGDKVIVASHVTPIERRGTDDHCDRSPVPPGTFPLPLPPPPLPPLLSVLSLPPVPPSPANIICRQGAVL